MSNRIANDKYYTPNEVVDLCLSELKKAVKADGIIPSVVIEPSAGNGAFSSKISNCMAYDIEPESRGIIKQDFLELESIYLKNSVIVTNPPFGRCLNLAQKFFKKSIEIADYIGFILPISQLNNNRTFYEFELVKSIDLGEKIYTDRSLHCCFNIYRRPSDGLRKRINTKLQCVRIIRQDSKNYSNEWFDIRMCYWGNGSAGKILTDKTEAYSGEYKIQVHKNYKESVKKALEEVVWIERLNKIAMLRIKQYDIVELLKEKIKDIY
ncbi:MAG: hypothetical protein ACRC0F_09655 [Cetobacterium sp.]